MDSNTNLNSSSGLLRFRSAPSSFLSYFADDAGLNNNNSNNNNKGSSIETERLFSRYVNDAESWPSSFQELEDKSTVVRSSQPQQQVGVGLPPHYPRQQSSSYGLVVSAALDHHPPQPKTVTGASLVRQSSSPAGLFSNNSVQNNGFPFGAWNDPSSYAENLGGMRRDQDNDGKIFSAAQNGDFGNRIHILSHHLSLPKNSAEAAMEKFLQLQDSVPCKVRAKRGCATHPRSIAERVRRTRISERMRKLQELVPNMDMQTNTADMLDLAVDYIKELQKQYKSLSDVRVNCKCLSMQKPVQKRIV